MGTLTNALMRVLLSWVRGFVSLLWSIADGKNAGFLEFFRKSWLPVCVVLVLFGLVMDIVVWLVRYKPYMLLAARFRERFSGEEEKPEKPAAEPEELSQESWLPSPPSMSMEEEKEILREASEIPDSSLGDYPGMRYQEPVSDEKQNDASVDEKTETQRFKLVSDSGKQAEVEPKKAGQTESEREYAQRLAEYERRKAQYDLEMAEYKKKMAAYEAAQRLSEESVSEGSGQTARRRRRGGE